MPTHNWEAKLLYWVHQFKCQTHLEICSQTHPERTLSQVSGGLWSSQADIKLTIAVPDWPWQAIYLLRLENCPNSYICDEDEICFEPHKKAKCHINKTLLLLFCQRPLLISSITRKNFRESGSCQQLASSPISTHQHFSTVGVGPSAEDGFAWPQNVSCYPLHILPFPYLVVDQCNFQALRNCKHPRKKNYRKVPVSDTSR